MRIALYARKSTESDDRQIQSLDDQIAALTQTADKEGWKISEYFVESRSARSPGTRPEFERMVREIEAGNIDTILTWSMDRLARNPVDGGRIQYLLQLGKIGSIRTAHKQYLPQDSSILLSIETGSATDYVRNLSVNVKRGLESKVAKGWHVALAPVGYLNDPYTHEIVPDPVRFPLVRKGWDMLLTGGYTLPEVERELTGLGLTRPKGPSSGKPLPRATYYKVFSNPFYFGTFRFRSEYRLGRHAPMVSRAEFDHVQRVLGRPSRKRIRTHDFAFAGLLRCGECGCQVVAERKTKRYERTGRTVDYVYYHCTGAKGCPKKGVSEETLGNAFLDAFDRIKIPDSFAAWAAEEVRRQANPEVDGLIAGDIATRRQVEIEKRRLANLRDMVLDGSIPPSEHSEMRGDLAQRIARGEAALEETGRREDLASAIIDERLSVAARARDYEKETVPGRRAMVQSLGATQVLNLESLEIRVSPILQKIAAFEPLREGSGIPKNGDILGEGSIWLGLIDAIRTAARLEADEELGRRSTLAEAQRARKADRRRPIGRNRPPGT